MSFRASLGGFAAAVALVSLAACDQPRDLASGSPRGTAMQRSSDYATGSNASGAYASESGGGPRRASNPMVQPVSAMDPLFPPAEFPSNRAGSD